LAKISGFKKLLPYNNPKILMVVATFGAMLNGSSQPILGVVFAKLIGLLSTPTWYLNSTKGENYL
jgi:ATP-binding cassette subfamily B (MDR/TAP) protein 1